MKKVYFGIICVIILCGVGIGEYYLYQDTKRLLNEQAIIMLKDVSGKYFDREFTKLNIPFVSQRKSNKSQSASRTRSVTDKNGKVTTIVSSRKDSLSLSSTIEGRKKEFVVLRKGHLSPDSLRLCWNDILLASGIVSDNALLLTLSIDGCETQYLSCSNSHICNSRFQLDSLYGGWQYELVVEPFINYSNITVIKKDNRTWILFMSGLGCIMLLILLRVLINRIRKLRLSTTIKSVEPLITSVEKGLLDLECYSFGDLLFDSVKGKLFIRGKEVRLRPQLQTLLLMFLKAPDYFLTKEEIVTNLWQGKLFVNDSLRRVLRDLRLILEDNDSSTKLISNGKGFQLVSDNEQIIILD